MSLWKPQEGRLTIFPSVPVTGVRSALDFYQDFWQREPDSFQKQVAGMGPFAPSVAQGTLGELSFTCSLNPIRLDIAIVPAQAPSSGPDATLQLINDSSNFHLQLKHIIDVIRKNPSAVPTTRTALAVKFASITKSFSEANRLLTSTLPDDLRVKLSDEEDFILQVNRVRDSTAISDTRINFITKWAVERVQLFTLTIIAGGPTQEVGSPAVNFINATITCDNNNVPTTKPLSGLDQSAILIEALGGVEDQVRKGKLQIEGF